MNRKNRLTLFGFLIILFTSEYSFAGEWNYYIHDHLGNTRVVLDNTGKVKEFYDYEPFGKTLRENIAGEEKAVYKFTGKELDDEGGLNWYYFGARYYDPAIGRWMGVDPMACKYPSLSPYVYVANNPCKLIDPDGRKIEFIGTKTERDRWNNYKSNLFKSPESKRLYVKLDASKQIFSFSFDKLPGTEKGSTSITYSRSREVDSKNVKLDGTETIIDENKTLAEITKGRATVEGVVAHEFKHIEDAADNPTKSLKDQENEKDTPYRDREQEKRAEITRIKVEKEIIENKEEQK